MAEARTCTTPPSHETVGVRGSLFKVLDLTTPTAPLVAGTFPGFTTAVALAGHTAYAVQLGSSVDLVVVDVATPASPAFMGRLTVGAGGDLKVVGSLVYVASGGYGLKIVDVSTPR